MQRVRHFFPHIAVLLAYVALALAGLQFSRLYNFVSPIWPASGVAIFAIHRLGKSAAIPVWIAAAFVNWLHGASPLVAMAVGLGNTLEALLANAIAAHWIKSTRHRGELVEFLQWTAAVGLACVVAGVTGAYSLFASGNIEASKIGGTILTWWAGDFLGGLLIFTLLRAGTEQVKSVPLMGKLRSAGVVLLMLATPAACRFLGYPDLSTMVAFIVFVYAAQSLTDFGSVLAMFALSCSLLICEMFSAQSFAPGDWNERILVTQAQVFACYFTFGIIRGLAMRGLFQNTKKPLVFGWIIAAVLIGIMSARSHESRLESLRFESEKLSDALAQQFDRYVQELKAGAALLRATDGIMPAQWETFANTLAIVERMPAVANLSAVFQIDAKDAEAYERKMSAAYGKEFKIRPVPGNQSLSTMNVITFIAPIERNSKALGVDVGSEPRRRAAADLAFKTGRPSITAPIQLVQDNVKRPSVLLYQPVTDHRIGRFFVNAPIVLELFFQEVEKLHDKVSFQLTDIEMSAEGPLFTGFEFKQMAEQFLHIEKKKVTFGQRQFLLEVVPRPGLYTKTFAFNSVFTLILALLVLFISGYVSMLDHIRTRAEILAGEMSQALDQQRAIAQNAAKMSALGEMAGSIAHEVNNPLAVISGTCQQIIRGLNEQNLSPEAMAGKVRRITETVDRIAKVIRSMRTLSRDGLSDPFKREHLSKIVADAMDLCNEKFKNNGVKVIWELDDAIEVKCRFVQLSQVLLNLVNNAYHAVEQTKEPWIKIKTEASDGKARLLVIDSGSGIPSSVVEKMMQPFFTTKDVGKGTGLGLSISLAIMESHRGTLRYAPVGPNTCFEVELPLYNEAEKAAA